jgi:hypothetical protein
MSDMLACGLNRTNFFTRRQLKARTFDYLAAPSRKAFNFRERDG